MSDPFPLEFREVFEALFPGVAWPGDAAAALRHLHNEVILLRARCELDTGPVRPRGELVAIHDLLCHVVLLDTKTQAAVVTPEDVRSLMCNLDVLCWMLRHDHNNTFAKNVTGIQKQMLQLGLFMTRLPGEPE
jgi:hypothetical protein